jgi:hypothetical protein
MSRKQKHKARGRVTTKMSRDGLVERNEATGEDIRVSKRDVELDLRVGRQESGTLFQNEKRGNFSRGQDGGQSKKHKNLRPAEQVKGTDNNAPADIQTCPADSVPETAKQTETPMSVQHTQTEAQSETSASESVRHEQPLQTHGIKPAEPYHIPHLTQPIREKPPPVINETPASIEAVTQSQSETHSALKHDDGGKLRFKDGEKSPESPNHQQRQKTPRFEKTAEAEQVETGRAEQITGESAVNPPIADGTDADTPPPSPLKHDSPDRLRFEPDNMDARPISKPKQKSVLNQAPKPVADAKPSDTPIAEQRQETPKSSTPTQPQPENGQSPLKHDTGETPLRQDKTE